MKKSSYTSKNSVAKLYKPISGMCNTISGEYIKDNQACHISGVIYNEDINSFSGSYLFDTMEYFKNMVFSRLYNVHYNGKQCLFATYNGGVYDITNNKRYNIENNAVPSDIISNQDGIFIASTYNIYHLKNDSSINKITYSLAPFSWQRLSPRQSDFTPANSLMYFSSRLYFSDSRGVGYMVEGSSNVKIIDANLTTLDFYVCNNTLFAGDYRNIYIISNDEIIMYADISAQNFNTRFTAAYGNELLNLTNNTTYEVAAFNTLNKSIKRYPVYCNKGLGTYGQKYIRVFNNEIFLLINETDSSMAQVKSSLYKLYFNGSSFSISATLFIDFINTIFLQNVFYVNGALLCYFSATAKHINASKTVMIYEYSQNKLVLLDYINPPENNASSSTITINNNRLYVANYNGIFYVDVSPEMENIPCLLIQNGRLVVPQGSSLYFSGIGDFYNWAWGTDLDALFVEIGYKDGGRITYAVVVLDSIIIFKDNGNIYRLAGSYPNWIVSKLGEVDKVTSRAITYGSSIIFGAASGIKKISATEYYGDFFLSDYQKIIKDKNVVDICLINNRNTLMFTHNDYIFEYSNTLGGYSIYTLNNKTNYKQILEIYNGNYITYALDNSGKLCIEDKSKLDTINVVYKEVKSNLNMVIKAITVYTPVLSEDKNFTLLLNNMSYNLILKSGQTKHKYFITKKVNKIQIDITHNGDFFIDNIFIEYSTIGK